MQHISQLLKAPIPTRASSAPSTPLSTQDTSASSPSATSANCPVCHGEHGRLIQQANGTWLYRNCQRCAFRESIARLQGEYPLAPAFRRVRLDFEPMDPNQSRVLAHSRRYVEKTKGWFVVGGNSGNGKSILLAGIYNALAAGGHTCLYLTAQTIVDLYHRALDPESDLNLNSLHRTLARVEFLAVDEVCKADWTRAFAHNEFYEMVNQRYGRMAWTAFAFNDADAIPEAIMSRMRDRRWGDGVEVDGKPTDGVFWLTTPDVRPYLESLWVAE